MRETGGKSWEQKEQGIGTRGIGNGNWEIRGWNKCVGKRQNRGKNWKKAGEVKNRKNRGWE